MTASASAWERRRGHGVTSRRGVGLLSLVALSAFALDGVVLSLVGRLVETLFGLM